MPPDILAKYPEAPRYDDAYEARYAALQTDLYQELRTTGRLSALDQDGNRELAQRTGDKPREAVAIAAAAILRREELAASAGAAG